MLTIIFNNDSIHAIELENYNQSTILSIANYSEHQTNINFNTNPSAVSNIMNFEDTAINNIEIKDEEDNNILQLDLTGKNVYLLNYSTNIYNGGQNTSVTLGQVAVSSSDNEQEEGEEEGE